MKPKSRGSVKRPSTDVARQSSNRLVSRRVSTVGGDHRPACPLSNVCLISKKCMRRRLSTVKTSVYCKSYPMSATHHRLIIRVNPCWKAKRICVHVSRTA